MCAQQASSVEREPTTCASGWSSCNVCVWLFLYPFFSREPTAEYYLRIHKTQTYTSSSLLCPQVQSLTPRPDFIFSPGTSGLLVILPRPSISDQWSRRVLVNADFWICLKCRLYSLVHCLRPDCQLPLCELLECTLTILLVFLFTSFQFLLLKTTAVMQVDISTPLPCSKPLSGCPPNYKATWSGPACHQPHAEPTLPFFFPRPR